MNSVQKATDHMVEARIRLKWNPSQNKNGGATGDHTNVLCGALATDSTKYERMYACHNPIHSFHNAEVMWSCFGYRTDKKIAARYHAWVTEQSPWAKTGIVPKQDPEFSFREGFVFKDLDKTPANLLHNFLIASRMAAEWPTYIEPWHELVTDHKVNPDLAFVFLTCFTPLDSNNKDCCFTPKTESIPTTMDKYDWPLDMSRASESYVRNFLAARPTGISKKSFSPTCETSPVNTLWGKLLKQDNPETYVNYLENQYTKDYTVKRSKRLQLGLIDRGAENYNKVFTPESILEILKLEEKRLCK